MPKHTKPLILAMYFPQVREMTGAPRSALNLLLGLDRDRWRAFLVTDTANPLADAVKAAGYAVNYLPLPPLLSLRDQKGLHLGWADRVKAIALLRQHQHELATMMVHEGVDIVWGRNAKGVLFACRGAHRAGSRYVWDIGLENVSKGPIYPLHSWALWQVDAIVTQSPGQAEKIFGSRRARRYSQKVHCLPPAVDPDRAQALVQSGAERALNNPVFLCVGTIHPRKNQLTILRAAAPVLRQFPNSRLQFAGSVLDKAYDAMLRDFTQHEQLRGQVDFLGWRDNIPELMSKAHTLVLSSSNEGLPQVVREAMLSGLAIVSSAVGGIPDVLQDGITGLLFHPEDEMRLRAHLSDLAGNPQRVRALGSAAQHYALTRFSLAGWHQAYNDLLWKVATARR